MNVLIETIDDIYPDSDGKPMAETGIHVKSILWLLAVLALRFKNRKDVYVAANMFLYYAEGKPKKRRAPDVMFAKGVKGNYERRSFKTWVEGVVPSCIIEVTSKKTAVEDRTKKKPLYQKLGVREYFLFDPLDEYLPSQLMGFRLIGTKYARIKHEADGSLLSKEIGARLRPEGFLLGCYDAKTGARWPNPDDIGDAAQNAIKDLDNAIKDLDDERRRVAELQAELARLKRSRNGHSR